jgi:integrase/recombinase XerD
MGAIYTEGDGRWWLEVVGKGAKPRRLPVVPELLAAWQAYRSGFGLPAVAARAEPVPLVLSIRPGMPAGAGRTSARAGKWSGIGDEAIGKAIRQLFTAASDLALKAGHADSATVLRQASTHWLRHTMLTRQANRNVALKTLQETAGHASLSTTAMYLHKSDHERHDELLNAMEKAGGWPGK